MNNVTSSLSQCAICGTEISHRAKTCSDACRKRLSRTETRSSLRRIRRELKAIRRATTARPDLMAETVLEIKDIEGDIRDLLMHLKDAEEMARRQMLIEMSIRRRW